MQKLDKLLPTCFYHIYNRGNNRENIFIEDQNYHYFFELWLKYIEPIAETYAYCLLKNHFHFLIRIRDEEEITKHAKTFEVYKTSKVCNLSQPFSNFFNAYTKAINKRYNRTGSLFQTRFRRRIVTTESHLIHIVYYIHFNPQKHGFVDDFRDYPFSSYGTLLSNKQTRLKRDMVIKLFGSKEAAQEFHLDYKEKELEKIQSIIEDDEF